MPLCLCREVIAYAFGIANKRTSLNDNGITAWGNVWRLVARDREFSDYDNQDHGYARGSDAGPVF